MASNAKCMGKISHKRHRRHKKSKIFENGRTCSAGGKASILPAYSLKILVLLNKLAYPPANFFATASERVGMSRCLVPRNTVAVEESPVKFIDVKKCPRSRRSTFREESMMRTILATAAVVLFCLVHIETTSAQSTNASVGGFVQDSSQAFIPGVTVTATNTQTGVVNTALTNESGAYNFTALLPGTYNLTAELPGFKTQVISAVQLGQSATARYNFTLQVGAADQTVEVTAEATALIAESSSTVGNILTEKNVRDLPLVTNNVLDLMQTMTGVRGTDLTENTTFAGVSTSMVNTVRDGLSVQNGRYANGVGSVTMLHPDMVGEMRVILTPVDAELGRGNGQVEILTRSGTNQFHGSGFWTVRNSKLDANTWTNNKAVVNGKWTPTAPPWHNRNELTGSVGGPIVKNKTFFFALVDKQIEN